MTGIIAALVIVYIAYLLYKQWESSRPEKKIEKLEGVAEFWKANATKDLLGSLGQGKDEYKFLIQATEEDYLHLKERFAHDTRRLLEIASDWAKYTEAVNDLSIASDMLTVDLDYDAPDKYGERVREPQIKRQEIERRFQEMLGNAFVDRQEQWEKNHPSPYSDIWAPLDAK